MAAMYGVYHGPVGLKRIAADVHDATRVLARGTYVRYTHKCKAVWLCGLNETYLT